MRDPICSIPNFMFFTQQLCLAKTKTRILTIPWHSHPFALWKHSRNTLKLNSCINYVDWLQSKTLFLMSSNDGTVKDPHPPSAVATDGKRLVFIPIPKKGNAKECSNYHTIALISHASKVILKNFQARLQQYVTRELPDVQAGFRKGRRTRDQIANIRWIIKKAREFQKKNIYFCFIDYAKAFDCVDHNKLWKILKDMGIPDHLTYLLRNLNAGQEATVRTGHGTTDWFQIGKGVCQGCI